METIKNTRTARFGLLKMYREEVDQLVAMFQRSCEKVTISDNKYRYESLDEMKQNVGSRIKDFDIRGENPGVRFLFNQTEAAKNMGVGGPPTYTTFNELRTEEITAAADALFFEIKDSLLPYQQPTFRKVWIVPLVVSFTGIFWFAIRNSHANEEGHPVVYLGWGLLTSILMFVISISAATHVRNYLNLETRRDSPSFFKKYREDFAKHGITSVITAVVSGIVGLFFGWLLGHFGK
jgi:hypothetical protein